MSCMSVQKLVKGREEGERQIGEGEGGKCASLLGTVPVGCMQSVIFLLIKETLFSNLCYMVA